MTCARCGLETPRLTVEQTRCPQCQREVDRRIASDTARRSRIALRPKVFIGPTLPTPFSGRPAL